MSDWMPCDDRFAQFLHKPRKRDVWSRIARELDWPRGANEHAHVAAVRYEKETEMQRRIIEHADLAQRYIALQHMKPRNITGASHMEGAA